MISDRPELIQKKILDNSEDLNFYLRDLKQWEAEIKQNDKQLLQATSEDGQQQQQQLPTVRNSNQKDDAKHSTVTSVPLANSEHNTKYDCTEDAEVHRLKQRAILEKEKGNSFLKIGKYDQAIECYKKGQQLDPFNALLPANRALALLKLEQFAAAEEACDLAISIDPTYVKVYQRRATARLASKKYDEAVSDYLEVLRLEPQNKEARNQLCKVEKILTENNLKAKMNIDSIDVFPIHKEPQQRSKVQLRRIEVSDIPREAQPIVPVVRSSVEASPDDSAAKRVPDLPKPPLTSYEFQTELRRLKSYPELVYRYIKEIPCEKYAQFFQHNLESESLSQMFRIFLDYYMWNNNDIYEPLFNLSQTKRFDTLKMFFSETDKGVLKEIFDHMLKTQVYSTDQLKSLRQCYEF